MAEMIFIKDDLYQCPIAVVHGNWEESQIQPWFADWQGV